MRRILLAAALAATLTPTVGSTFLDPFWSFFSSLWGGQATLDEGCGFDPSGRCHTAAQIQPDEGCGFDPDGRCQAASQIQPDAGCGFDPDGRCHAAAQIQPDAGCGFDPSGRCQPGS
ncbi:MAG TPA: hypothetical protein VH988_01950 [Thermoanaerobaculia bacterium]|jgi:hypothetical protein|nr:hypothetical protein [Thermoanaerobaculia bacterium]